MGRQDAKHPGFRGANVYHDCTRCIRSRNRKGAFPGRLLHGNRPAFDLYLRIRGQQRIGGMAGVALGLDWSILPFVFEVYEIPRRLRRLLFEKLVILDGEFGARAAEREAARAATREAVQRLGRG